MKADSLKASLKSLKSLEKEGADEEARETTFFGRIVEKILGVESKVLPYGISPNENRELKQKRGKIEFYFGIFGLLVSFFYNFWGCSANNYQFDVAFGQKTTQSSVENDHGSYLVVGANIAVGTLTWGEDGLTLCSVTQEESFPFWQVDLGESHKISDVVVVGGCNQQSPGEELVFRVILINEIDGYLSPFTCGASFLLNDLTQTHTLSCPQSVARYVRIQPDIRTGKTRKLCLCSVKVHGLPAFQTKVETPPMKRILG